MLEDVVQLKRLTESTTKRNWSMHIDFGPMYLGSAGTF